VACDSSLERSLIPGRPRTAAVAGEHHALPSGHVREQLGEPVYVGSCVDPGFPTERWQSEYDARQVGYLAVWQRPGLEFHLYAAHAGLEFDPAHPAISVRHLVRRG